MLATNKIVNKSNMKEVLKVGVSFDYFLILNLLSFIIPSGSRAPQVHLIF
jgi:ABC-type uncharacterized transport system ATPase subunit